MKDMGEFISYAPPVQQRKITAIMGIDEKKTQVNYLSFRRDDNINNDRN